MTEGNTGPSVLVLTTSWRKRETELSFVTRAVAGAASRRAAVTVVTPSPSGTVEADGAFDLRGIGQGHGGGWPDAGETQWIPDASSTWVFDEPEEKAGALFEAFGGGAPAYSLTPLAGDGLAGLTAWPLVPDPGRGPSETAGVYVPVNPLAAEHRHGGFGFTGYILVLTDRPSRPRPAPPTPAVAWLTARFHRQFVVVVEGGRAAAWRGRALRGVVSVDSRIDLWRLMAHASAMVDLAPGPLIGRECVESLRFGTPIIVPRDAAGSAPAHAEAGGGFTFSGAPELLDAVEQLLIPSERDPRSRRGALYANYHYGDPAAFVAAVARVLDADHH
jgi:hypothetical protein